MFTIISWLHFVGLFVTNVKLRHRIVSKVEWIVYSTMHQQFNPGPFFVRNWSNFSLRPLGRRTWTKMSVVCFWQRLNRFVLPIAMLYSIYLLLRYNFWTKSFQIKCLLSYQLLDWQWTSMDCRKPFSRSSDVSRDVLENSFKCPL